MSNEQGFAPGDIIEIFGETYQVLENNGSEGLVIPFPSDLAEGTPLQWVQGGDSCRKIGHAPLPAPTPCSSGECPTEGKISLSNGQGISVKHVE